MDQTYLTYFVDFSYLIASICFIFCLKFLNSPETARRGVLLAEIGMALAIIGTLIQHEIVSYEWIIVGLIIGGAIGVVIALWTPMTHMPQRTALSHAFGAIAVSLVGIAEYSSHGTELGTIKMAAIGFECLLGALTFTGSMQAFLKLQEWMRGAPITFKGQNAFNMGVLSVMLGLLVYLIIDPTVAWAFYLMVALGFVFGILLVMPIGAADMPVVISLLNSYAGLAGSATGFVLGNKVLIIAGALDGASGVILSIIMCKAMNRSMANVLFGAFGSSPAEGPSLAVHATAAATVAAPSGPTVKALSTEQAAGLFKNKTKSVIIVPGYGMAAAQAQHAVRKLADQLKGLGVSVKYAIHPVAGRMPGHMNVLLAEANVPYTDLFDMEDINEEFPETDIALVIGANDVTNPAARSNPQSPIYGMPILDVDKAKTVIVCKRSMKPGFAGIDNDLYLMDQTYMYFGDAKSSISKLVDAIKSGTVAEMPVAVQASVESAGPVVKKLSPEEAAELFKKRTKSVIIVPGYGMAAAQAQHAVRELSDQLKTKGVTVKYAIHPVAGRMPGHMNVLLAEANVPYTDLFDMEDINDEFEETDVALVVGANDVTNPAARNNPKSPIYGMPILNVDKAKTVIVCKRSMKPGFAGIDNELYLMPQTYMYFGDAKSSIGKLVDTIKADDPVLT